MFKLRSIVPKAENLHLYETAMQMEYFQTHGVLDHKLSLEQIGMGISGNRFFQKDTGRKIMRRIIRRFEAHIGEQGFEKFRDDYGNALEKLDIMLAYFRKNNVPLDLDAETTIPKSVGNDLNTPINEKPQKKETKNRRNRDNGRDRKYVNNSKKPKL